MSLQQDIVPELVKDINSYHDECAIVLIGSVAWGSERPESDIDFNIFFPNDHDDCRESPYIDSDNRWQLKVKGELHGIRIDIAWETYDGLEGHLLGDGPINCWPFSNGKILHDPSGTVAPCLTRAQRWFAKHADIASRIEAEYVRSKRTQIRERERP
ncbi:MAG: nucleotidyltransferase domain-containing protein [Planctomycetes bacterium]|nr:nucleotidyltransferase domain-containing protein [Planctomycetota bacterium]